MQKPYTDENRKKNWMVTKPTEKKVGTKAKYHRNQKDGCNNRLVSYENHWFEGKGNKKWNKKVFMHEEECTIKIVAWKQRSMEMLNVLGIENETQNKISKIKN